jgi:glycosyltransferase involved in cell wall biosynthesis
MNILILCTKMPWPPKDGGTIATLNLAMGMANQGASISLLTMNTPKHYYPPDKVPPEVRKKLNLHSVDVNTRILPFRMLANLLFSRYPYIAERFVSGDFAKKLDQILEQADYDIVQIEGPYLKPYLSQLKNSQVKVLRSHNIEHRIWELRAKEEKNPLKKIYFRILAKRIRQLEKDLLSEIDLLVPISEKDSEGLSAFRPDLPLHVCPTGIKLADYPADPPPEKEPELFFIGALDWAPNQEGLDWFLKNVWPGLRREGTELRLHVAGRNPGHYFRTQPPEGIILEGEVENAIEYFKKYQIMLVPLLTGSGIRIKILEAMAMCKVVVCSRIAAEGLNAENGRHLFIAESEEEYSEILGKLISDPALLAGTGQEARRFIKENFDNLGISKNLISFYKTHLS